MSDEDKPKWCDEDKPKGDEQLALARAWALFLFITVAATTALVLITVVAANLVGALGDAVRSSGPCVEETLSNNVSGETCWHPQHRLYEGEARWVCRCEPPSPERK